MTTLARLTAIIAIALAAGPALAQKGTGDATGLARQGARPAIESFSGTITDIKVGPCEQTTGRSAQGMHLFVRRADDATINLHLGPPTALDGALQRLTVGQTLRFEAFRTDRLPKDAYIAVTLTTDGATLRLRDENLRPAWAGAGRGQGQGWGQGRVKGGGRCYW